METETKVKQSFLTEEQMSRQWSKWLPDTNSRFRSSQGTLTNKEWLHKMRDKIGGEVVVHPKTKMMCLLSEEPLIKLPPAYSKAAGV